MVMVGVLDFVAVRRLLLVLLALDVTEAIVALVIVALRGAFAEITWLLVDAATCAKEFMRWRRIGIAESSKGSYISTFSCSGAHCRWWSRSRRPCGSSTAGATQFERLVFPAEKKHVD